MKDRVRSNDHGHEPDSIVSFIKEVRERRRVTRSPLEQLKRLTALAIGLSALVSTFVALVAATMNLIR